MFTKKLSKRITLGLLALSITATSWASAFATSSFAASLEDESTQAVSAHENSANVGSKILGGLLAIGLIAAITNNGDNNDGTSPSKSASPIPSSNSSSNIPSQTTNSISSDEQRAFNLLNADRVANGLPPLKLNTSVAAVARRHAQDEIDRNFFAHNNPDGLTPFDRMRAAGISFKYAGENLAINRDVASAEVAFMNSAGHRANILNPNYTEVGIGVRYNSQGSVYVVQNFISR